MAHWCFKESHALVIYTVAKVSPELAVCIPLHEKARKKQRVHHNIATNSPDQ